MDSEKETPAIPVLKINIPNLPETDFTATPTEDEIMALLRLHKDFWTRISGLLFVQGKFSITDQQQRMNKLLGLAAQTQMVIDAFQGTGQIAVPQPHLMPQGR